jgi:hypothetical protein
MTDARQRLVSRLLVGATILLPSGFFLGGVSFYAGDPGLGILLLPVGATMLLAGLYLIARTDPKLSDTRDKDQKRRP